MWFSSSYANTLGWGETAEARSATGEQARGGDRQSRLRRCGGRSLDCPATTRGTRAVRGLRERRASAPRRRLRGRGAGAHVHEPARQGGPARLLPLGEHVPRGRRARTARTTPSTSSSSRRTPPRCERAAHRSAGLEMVPLSVAELERICGEPNVLVDRDELRTYESDALAYLRGGPGCRLPARHGRTRFGRSFAPVTRREVPWVARGAGTGLSGGAMPIEDGVVIGLSRLRRILEVDLPNARVVVEPGVTNLAISHAVSRRRTSIRPTRRARSCAPSAATWRRTRAGRTASSTGSRRTTLTGIELVLPDGDRGRAGRQGGSTGPATTCSARSSARRGRSASRRGSRCASSPVPERIRTLVAYFDSMERGGPNGLRHRRRRDRAGRDRDHGPALAARRRAGDRAGNPTTWARR